MKLVLGAVLLGLVTATAGTAPVAAAAAAPASDRAAVVVQASDVGAATRAVRGVGGRVSRELALVDGVAATVPAAALPRLRRAAGVQAVTPDARLTVQATATEEPAYGSDLKSVYAEEVGAPALRALPRPGGLPRIALVDTGVTPGTDLAGRLVPVEDPNQGSLPRLDGRLTALCANFSGEPTCDDTYGHGTFLAGLMAGDGTASAGRFRGVAPQAEIVSVKIAGRDGSADVSKVLAAIQWVVTFRERYGIGVLNLSLGTDSTVRVERDPLNHAVQRAWEAGIVVVVAASNRGPAAATISKPADDPFVVTVGAVDDRETPALSDDRSPAFTGRGPTAHGRAKPDVVAPGVRLVSLRSRPADGSSSFIDTRAPLGAVGSYRRGSGTSMSTAVVSGVVALLRGARPTWSPDHVKTALRATAAGVKSTDPTLVGRGLVQGDAAAAFSGPTVDQGARTALGGGELERSRAHVFVERSDCDQAECPSEGGETTQQGKPFEAGEYTADSAWSGNSWYSSQWVDTLGNSWYGNSWYGRDSAVTGYGNSWYGNSWYGTEGDDPQARPFGPELPGSAWYGVYS